MNSLRDQIIGLGERSIRKSYYPELQEKLTELERFRTLLDHSHDMIFLLRYPRGEIIDANESACQQLLYTRSELLSLTLSDVLHHASLDRIRSLFESASAGRDKNMTFDSIICKKDRSVIVAEIALSIVAFRDATFAVMVIRDISERKHAEQQLAAANKQLENIIDFLPDATVIVDRDRHIIAWNRAMEKMTGCAKSVILGKDIAQCNPFFFKNPQKLILEMLLDDEMSLPSGYSFTRQDKERIAGETFASALNNGSGAYVQATASLLFAPDGTVVGAVESIRDITEKISAAHEKERLSAQLQQSQKMESIGRLAGGVAHDFNNMLSVIFMTLDLMKHRNRLDDNILASLRVIEKAAESSRDITRQLLAFSRRQVIAPKPCDLNGLITEMGKSLKHLIGEDIEIDLALKLGLGIVLIDPAQFDQIFMNLAVNARDAMPDGGKLLIETQNVDLSPDDCRQSPTLREGAYVLFAVTDTGMGMNPDTLSKIFEPFFTTKELGKGTGLGLATVFGIVEQNQGCIDVTSEPGKGTTFRIYFPRIAPDISDNYAALLQNAPGGSESILLVEDEDMLRNTTLAALRHLGYSVTPASGPFEAIDAITKTDSAFDLMLTDVVMPGMNGKELADKISALHPEIKVLFMSGYFADAIANRGILDDGINFIQKPLSIQDLALRIREVLRS